MAHYLLTGCAGFIGSNVAKLLLDEGHRVTGVDTLNDAYDVRLKHWRLEQLADMSGFTHAPVDIADRAALDAFAAQASRETPFDAVINLAARAGVRESARNPWVYFEANVTGTLNLLELCRHTGIRKFVLASTSSAYGANNPRPFREDANVDRPLSAYAASKRGAEGLCFTYHHLYGIDVTVLRYFTVYGPAGRPDMSIFRFVRQIREQAQMTVYGDGQQSRDFTYVEDVARGTIAAIRPVGFEVINLGSDHPYSLAQMIQMIEERLSLRANIAYEPVDPSDVVATWASIEKANRLLGWRPQITFEDGMQRTIDWYERHRSWASHPSLMKVVTVVGARPQFTKASPVCRELRTGGHQEVLVHTGQHYDDELSAVFFRELDIPVPQYNLGIGSGSPGAQTGRMLAAIDEVLVTEQPDAVLVYGDTTSTLAGALAAVKRRIRVVHVEAGLRSYNREMPEEHNRVLTDHCADVLLCPTQTAVDNLGREGLTRGVHLVGDTMLDAARELGARARAQSTILDRLRVKPGAYLLATVHRAYNTDDPEALREIISGLGAAGEPVVFPVHPRTRHCLDLLDTGLLARHANIIAIESVGYLDMLALEQSARLVLTDSGGVQKEAYFFGIPCLTLRSETEWLETVHGGWNTVVGADRARIAAAVREVRAPSSAPDFTLFGDGFAARKIVARMVG